MPRRARFAAALVALAWASPAPTHEFKLDSLGTAFVRIEPDAAHLVIRVPLHVFGSVRFPLRGREIVNAEAAPATAQAIALLREGVTLSEEGRALRPSASAGRISLPSNRAFDDFDEAVAHVARANEDTVFADQGYLDAHFTYPIASASSRFAIRTTLAPELGELLKLAIRYLPSAESERAMVVTRGSGSVALNPTRLQAAAGFGALGIEHILGGLDHLLFLLCLIVPLARTRQVIAIVTAFTVAHSVTLLVAAFGWTPSGAWFPPFVETTIAASIVYMAIENVLGVEVRRRWVVTALFGLVHGFGFSYGLQEHLQFAGGHLVVSLLAFNAGIEVGQLAVVAAILPVLALLRRAAAPRTGVLVVSAVVAHTGWHWMVERADVLWNVEWQQLGASPAVLARTAAIAIVAAGVLRLAWPRVAPALRRTIRRVAAERATD